MDNLHKAISVNPRKENYIMDNDEKNALRAWRGWQAALCELAAIAAGLALLHLGGCCI